MGGRILEIKELKNYKRENIINLIEGNNLRGIELGIARGIFAERMINSNRFSEYYGIDVYANDGSHTVNQYKEAINRVGIRSNFKLLRMYFKEALDLFEDEYFDFIYVDGYAHTGEEGGRTFKDWFPKLRRGGLFAGDDYDSKKWPLVVNNVNQFMENKGYNSLHLTNIVEQEEYCYYPTWGFIK